MTLKQAERASFGPNGCPKCGGADIDIDLADDDQEEIDDYNHAMSSAESFKY